MAQIKTILISLIIAFSGGILIFILGFHLSLWISPNRTPDGHVTMAIPQLFSGILIGIIGFIMILIVTYRKLKKRINKAKPPTFRI